MTRAADDRRWRGPIEGVKEPIADRFHQAIAGGFAIVERGRYLGIGTMTALPEKTADLAHRRDRAGGGAPRGGGRARGQVALPRHHEPRAAHAPPIIGFAELMLMRDVA